MNALTVLILRSESLQCSENSIVNGEAIPEEGFLTVSRSGMV